MKPADTRKAISEWLLDSWELLETKVLTEQVLLQTIYIVCALIIAMIIGRKLQSILQRVIEREEKERWFHPMVRALQNVATAICAEILLWGYYLIAHATALPSRVVEIMANLVAAWVFILFLSSFSDKKKLARWFAWMVWAIAALNILGLLDTVTGALDSVSFTFGEKRFSLLGLLNGMAAFALFIWVAYALSGQLERRIQGLSELTPSLRVLLSKAIKITLITVAFLAGLNTLGIDLTALAVFSGAVGVGIGFGLQKVVSNFISGIILLLDRSIKPGDIIALNDTYGWVNKLSARHVSVLTRDGKEHLIPNELLITEPVENWSYSSNDVRLLMPVGIAYSSDVRKAIDLMVEAAKDTPRVLRYPAPRCLLRGFGDSAVNLELRIWINDPAEGRGNIQSEIYLKIWDKFHENGIEFPFPQQDIHIRSIPPLRQSSENPATALPPAEATEHATQEKNG